MTGPFDLNSLNEELAQGAQAGGLPHFPVDKRAKKKPADAKTNTSTADQGQQKQS